jgi:hypothetical protein
VPGYWKIAPKTCARVKRIGCAHDHLDPQGRGAGLHDGNILRVAVFIDKNAVALDFATRCAMVIASAQAVASSRSEALATGSPVRSDTMV